MRLIAVIGDLVASSAVRNRRSQQHALIQSLERVNKTGGPLSRYTISAGDEVEAVYSDATSLFRHFWEIGAAIAPERIRFSIAIGGITTRVDRRNPLVMDGPAFHVARRALALMKKRKDLFRVSAEAPDEVTLEHAAAALLSHQVGHWSPTRWEVIRHLAAGHTPAEIAAAVGISLTAVYKNIRAGALMDVLDAGDAIGEA